MQNTQFHRFCTLDAHSHSLPSSERAGAVGHHPQTAEKGHLQLNKHANASQVSEQYRPETAYHNFQ